MAAAVITGDIVNSTLLSKGTATKLINTLGILFKPYKFEFYRGDSFQVYVKDVKQALQIVLQARAIARVSSSDIRASIGIGNVATPVRSLRTAGGEAFVLSGRTFDLISDNGRLRIQCGKEEADITFRIIAYYLDYIFSHLTSKQAEVVRELLKGYTQAKVAKRLRKAQPTINKIVQAAGWVEIDRLLSEYQHVITQFKIV